MRLAASDISKTFGGIPVLEHVSFDVAAGERAALVGPSGSGKTTLLRLIAGFDRVDAGEIRLGDRVVETTAVSIPTHRRGVGYVAQDGALFPHLTVAANIGFGLRNATTRAERVDEVMRLVDLDSALAGRYPHQLSGGQQQRVAVARALAPAPGVILLDEPFSALDAGLREQTREGVTAVLEQANVTTVLVTHDQDEALSFGQTIGVLFGGTLAQWGEPGSVFDDPATAEVAEFLGPAILLPATRSARGLECVLGVLPIRHDRSGGATNVLAMLRPDQITVAPRGSRISGSGVGGPSAGGCEIRGLRARGGQTDVTVGVGGRQDVTLDVRLPTHLAARFQPGQPVDLEIDDGVVVFPAG